MATVSDATQVVPTIEGPAPTMAERPSVKDAAVPTTAASMENQDLSAAIEETVQDPTETASVDHPDLPATTDTAAEEQNVAEPPEGIDLPMETTDVDIPGWSAIMEYHPTVTSADHNGKSHSSPTDLSSAPT